ncbi:MAG: LysM peptidoglycan-binding domain-containing M23 family metallopeptidase [Alphaproteobacteria bacterium]|nr:LysM peptidoglycan-binding domain-containing M23 family metallopeptidase [Alphaproteobacteria bacterium]
MKRSFHALLLISILGLAACLGTQKPAPVTQYAQGKGAGSAGIHTVSRGENLWTLSQRYGIAMPDIVQANALRAPFALSPGQRLRLPPPREYKARAGDTLYSVSRLFGVSTSDIARQNDLSAPFALTKGQILKLPGSPARLAAPAPHPLPSAPAEPDRAPIPSVAQPPTIEQTSLPPTAPVANKPSSPRRAAPEKTPPRSSASRFLKPVEGPVISGYGPKPGGLHNDGINIRAPRGTSVEAAENGVAVYAGNALKGSGNLVLIRHADRWMSAYGHMDSITVRKGQTIARGEKIGSVGSSGTVDEPQLHFELRRGTEALNPAIYIK